MTDNTTQSVNQAQDATRSMHQTLQGLMGVQTGQAHINFLEINNFKLLQSLFTAKY
jgi:hypothetical protein